MNKCFFIGNLTKDVELETTKNGVKYATFTLAVQRKYTNQNGEREANFIQCVAWRNLAENIHKYCGKGSKINIVGELEIKPYEATDGTKRTTTRIIVEEAEFIGKKNSEPQDASEPALQPISDDNLPF